MDYTHKLSDKLLCSIFSYLITSTVILPPYLGDPRLHLMAVSQRWRRVILESSKLWDTILVLPSSPEASLGLLKIAEQWLRIHWTNDHILSIFLLQPESLAHVNRQGSGERTFFGERFSVVDDGILPAARGMKFLSCTLGTERGIKSFFAIPPGKFSRLEKLEISLPTLSDQDFAHTMTMMI